MKKLFILFLVVLAFSACRKGKFETVPTVTIDSFGPKVVSTGDFFQLRATVTDKEGDVQDSVIIVRKRFSTDGSLLSTDSTRRVSLRGLGTPIKDRIELMITFVYGRLIPEQAITQDLEYNFDRNLTVGLIVVDNAGNRSEYVESEPIRLQKFQ
jgi:hypothetical protein